MSQDWKKVCNELAIANAEIRRLKNWLHGCERKRKILQGLCKFILSDDTCSALDNYPDCTIQCAIPGAFFDNDNLILPERR